MLNLESILKKLISFETVTGNAKEVSAAFKYIESLFLDLPAQFKYVKKGGHLSLIVYRKGVNWKKADIIFNGHLDVIPAPKDAFRPKKKGDRVYGRGSVDMKGGIVAIIEGMREFLVVNSDKNIVAVITSDEEIGGNNGVGHIVNDLGLRAKFAIVFDGPRYDQMIITTRQKGGLWLELTAKGKSAHASRPWLGENAALKLLKAIKVVEKHVGKTAPEKWKSTFNLALLETNNRTPNVIPDHARAVIDIRFTEALGKSPKELLDSLKKKVSEVSLRSLSEVDPLSTQSNNPFLDKFQAGAKKTTGKHLPTDFGHSASDGRYFATKGIPTIVVGAVGHNWHGENEWVSLVSVKKLCLITRAAVKEFLLK